jgi:hypothetical protein
LAVTSGPERLISHTIFKKSPFFSQIIARP